jgi:prolyl-tRNA editing enzyme YbaK/EbsC (Cys-tRNA(Pro) deacylase)
VSAAASNERPEGFQRVASYLQQAGHAQAPRWLKVAARTSQEAAQALGVGVGQIAKSVVFRRLSDERAVLVVASGDLRVDEAKVAALAGPLGRADAKFVKEKTGFAIGGVSPVAHASLPLVYLDAQLQRFELIWAAAGHPNGVFCLSPAQLPGLTGAAFHDVAQT